jgi:hypothetical protein
LSDERKAKVVEAENDLAEAEALARRLERPEAVAFSCSLSASQVRRMDLEARSLPVTVKTPLLTKLRDYKARPEGPAQRGTARLSRARCSRGEHEPLSSSLSSRTMPGVSPRCLTRLRRRT